MKIVATTCPVGDAAGHDADECRAMLNEADGTIACVTCATRYPKMSASVRQVFRCICSSGFHAPAVELGSSTQPGTGEYAAACLSGYDPAQSDRVQATFKRDGLVCKLDYEQHNEGEIVSPDRSLHRELSASERDSLPAFVRNCADALVAKGFCIRHLSEPELNGRRLVLSCGRSVGSMGAVIGMSVVLSWPVKS